MQFLRLPAKDKLKNLVSFRLFIEQYFPTYEIIDREATNAERQIS